MKNLKNSLLAFCLMLMISTWSYAQKSPAMTTEGKAGSTDISLKWGAPSVRGREIWGALEPYDKVWRTGANEATTIKFSKNVKINGQSLAAGEYSLFTIPTKSGEWTVIFNKVAKQWGAYKYKEEEDALRIKTTAQANEMTEQLAFKVENKGSKALVTFMWEKIKYSFEVTEN